MKTRAAALFEAPGRWNVVEMDLDEPKQEEVLVRMVASGLCHSDEHAAKGDMPVLAFPYVGGHEGAGVVEAVGPGVTSVKPGDHVVTRFIPSCGRCRPCTSGRMNLCDLGMLLLNGTMLDGTQRLHHDGKGVGTMCMLGTFSQYQVMSEYSLSPVRQDVPLEVACLVACGVATGFGSAQYAAEVKPGDTVIVMGIGGIGINAVQGAARCGAATVIAVDPVEFKREKALEVGADKAFATIEEAADHARSLTNGQGADSAIVCVGVTASEHVSAAYAAIAKGGTVVVTGIGNVGETSRDVNLWEMSMMQKRIQGVLYGSGNPGNEIPKLLDLYMAGKLKLDELVTRTYKLDEINEAYTDMYEGRNIRGVIHFDS